MKFLPPLKLKDQYYAPVEAEIMRLLADVIYRPLLKALKDPTGEIFNSGGALYDAIVNGTIYWSEGHFRGDFNSQTTRDLRAIGAMYNSASRTWSLARELIPTDLRFAQAGADQRYETLRKAFLHTLDDMDIGSIKRMSDIPGVYARTIDWMESDFQKSLQAITVPVKLTDAQRDIIASEWGQNLDLYVKNWASENIIKMRNEVQGNTFQGRRAADLIGMLKDNYGVGQRKAKFLARQETSLLMSKFRETRYRDAGANRYRWSTSHDERVRKDHRHLNGKIFTWDMPPVTDDRTGARNNPGEDFGCRCVAIALLD